MYLTFYTKKSNVTQVTFEDILRNPYMKAPTAYMTYKNFTKIVEDNYAEGLYNKMLLEHMMQVPFQKIVQDNEELKTLNTTEHYFHFEIPKKSDPTKKRPIDAPDDYLRAMQSVVKNYIEDYLSVIPHKAAEAYVCKHSVVTAMQKHVNNGSHWYLQIDLKNFFNSCNEEFVRRMLMEVFPFKFIPEECFEAIIKIAMLRDGLPQGSIISPLLTNLIMVPIDYAITETLHNYKHHHYVYTRYADDITISCKEKFDPSEILREVQKIFTEWNVPFRINNSKTRFGSTAGKNYHLGIIINNKGKNKSSQMSIGHEKNKRFRAMLFNFGTTGDEWEISDIQKMLGLISYYKSIEKPYVIRTINKYNNKFGFDLIAKAKEMIK